ncbi:MAG: PP2C family serine/threonine-protein phosphatase [Synechococcales bacterium]|nr:PP2C family serine/threonine-protein phosphatase [Synechococcales bacterium]
MSRFELKIYCTHPHCDRPENGIGAKVCANCGTPIPYQYLWAIEAAHIPIGSIVGGQRYQVVAPQLWLDLQPGLTPLMPDQMPEALLPYLHLYSQRLHLPGLYGFCSEGGRSIPLLENAPISPEGIPYPALRSTFGKATAVRQLYWLWQILNLWKPLLDWQVASSLLEEDWLRVQDWRVRLQQLKRDETPPTLANLAELWSNWLPAAHPSIFASLQDLCGQMHDPEVEWSTIRSQLNQLLLQQAAQLSLGLQVYGQTDPGKTRSHNEDSCYPLRPDAGFQDDLMPRLAIVCDGIGGHEGGEVASALAVQAIQPQIRALLAEIAEQAEIVAPEIISEQLAAIARIVNNLIASQNDSQDRQDRRRMGTTLVLALQVPQRIKLPTGVVASNSHELYLMNVGDSRAYWLSPRGYHPLTVDDDVAVREVRMGRSLYRMAIQRPDAGALTQALGTRSSDLLKPVVHRFILEEDGVLLLCSDGLSDRDLVETAWSDRAEAIVQGQKPLADLGQFWINLANERNGSDNISLVMMRCQVSTPLPNIPLSRPDAGLVPELQEETIAQTESDNSRDPSVESSAIVLAKPQPKRGFWWKGLLLILALAAGGIYGWSVLDPASFNPVRDRIQREIQPYLPK